MLAARRIMFTPAPTGGPFSDNFNRANSTTNPNPASDGSIWTVIAGAWGILTGTTPSAATVLYTSGGSPGWTSGGSAGLAQGPGSLPTQRMIGQDLGATAQDVTVIAFGTGGFTTGGSEVIYLNYDPVTRGAYGIVLDDPIRIERSTSNIAASTTTLASHSSPTSWPKTGTTVRVHRTAGGVITVFVNGTAVTGLSVTDGSPLTGTWVCLGSSTTATPTALAGGWDDINAALG